MSRLRADLQLDDLVESIIRDLPGRVAAMERAFADQDLETLAVLAHQLKGAGEFYGSREISEAAGQLETTVKTTDQVEAMLAALARLCGRG